MEVQTMSNNFSNNARNYTLTDLMSIMEPQAKADRELIALTLQGIVTLAAAVYDHYADAVKVDKTLGTIRMIRDFWGLGDLDIAAAEIPDCATVVYGLVRHAHEELLVDGLEFYPFVAATKELLDELAALSPRYQELAPQAQYQIDAMVQSEFDALLPDGNHCYTFQKAYDGGENGELLIIATDKCGHEYRYVLIDGRMTDEEVVDDEQE
jgi:hypothetical protein